MSIVRGFLIGGGRGGTSIWIGGWCLVGVEGNVVIVSRFFCADDDGAGSVEVWW